MKQFLFLTCFLLSTFVFSQEKDQIENLEHQKQQLKLKIKSFQDSLKQINIRIAEIKSEKFYKKANDSTFTAIAKKGAILRQEQSPFSEIVMVLKTDRKVILLDYYRSYGIFRVCSNSVCGFMNEIWIKSNKKTSYFKQQRKENNRLLNVIQKTKSSNYNSSLNNISNNSDSKTKIKKTNNYYKHKKTKNYIRGPRGGCYYINSNGNKTYINRGMCN